MDEFGLIDTFVSQFDVAPPPRGPGDDCAVLPKQGPSCVTTDALVEGVHFTRGTFSMPDVGHKALAVNLSDLAAMGARPAWFTVALGLPGWATARDVKKLGGGMARLAKLHRVELIGGNVTRADQLSLTLTLSGALEGPPLLRSGAKPGDALYLSGPVGDAALGLSLLGTNSGASSPLVDAQRRPVPHVAFGRFARRHCSAGIDVSDGLAQDLGHLCRASGVAAELDSAALPMSEALLDAAGSRKAAQPYALRGGEDYVLLVAVRDPPAFERALTRAGFEAWRIGTLRKGSGVNLDGVRLTGRLGFTHR
ncbi:MAG: thiamine-phosphate kinase [Archangium sp.]|nr:thiamine-phosphate kinase [Archangium sp.]